VVYVHVKEMRHEPSGRKCTSFFREFAPMNLA
jgi:hypothetical protein